MQTTETAENANRGVLYARIAGHIVGALLIAIGLSSLLNPAPTQFGGPFFSTFKASYFILFGALLNAPFPSIPQLYWKPIFIAFTLACVLFVFTMIAHVMFGYMAAAEKGERLGVPGFEGTLIFLSLMQVPAVLFQRYPDMLD